MRAFLFDPAAAVATLADYPNLAATTDPRREGSAAEWLEGMRKSERQLYRVLGNTHYEHLIELLAALDFCLGCGFNQPTLLRSRAQSVRRRARRAAGRRAFRASRRLDRWLR